MYPFKFNPILKSTIWGGEKIIPFKHLNIEQPQVGESWEISNVPGDESVVANGTEAGKNLSQLVKEYKGSLVGDSNYQRFGDNFPLLIKFIDACDDLSIQVHPDDELAKKRHNSMGKTEMWYVIDNAGGKAHLRSGLSKKITPDEYAAMIADNTICDALADYAVQPGDVFFLPAGRIHSIGAGCFIAEIQQTSNVTYRIYDFNRKDKNGNTRELHTELSKDAIDYSVEEDYRTHYTPKQNEPVELVTCPYFTTSVYDLTENMNMDYSELDSFVIYICMEGACTVTDNEGNTVYVHDHNQDNKFDDNDKALAPGAYDTHSSAYTYTAEKNKGGFLIPTYSPDIFDMFDFGDWLAAMTGILGKLPENLNKDNSNGFFTFAYTFEGDYPKTLQVNAKEHGEEFKATMTFE